MVWLFPAVALYAPKGLVPLSVATAVALLFDPQVRLSFRCKSLSAWPIWILPLAVWALISTAWAPKPGASLGLWVSLIALCAVGWILATAATIEHTRWRGLQSAFAANGLILLLLLSVENFGQGVIIKWLKISEGQGVNDYLAYINPGNAMLVLFLAPFASAIRARAGRFAGSAMVAASLLVLYFGTSTTPLLAAALAMGAGIAALFWSRIVAALLAAGASLGVLGAPFIIDAAWRWATERGLLSVLGTSEHHRWAIWRFVVDRIYEKPLLGWGFNASRDIPGGHQNLYGLYGEVLPLHPHNGFLQIWLEMGFIGAMAAAILFAAVPFVIRGRNEPRTSAVLTAVWVAYLVPFLLSYGLWQNWWLAGLALAIASARLPLHSATR